MSVEDRSRAVKGPFPARWIVALVLTFYFSALIARIVVVGIDYGFELLSWAGVTIAGLALVIAAALVATPLDAILPDWQAIAAGGLTVAAVAVVWGTAVFTQPTGLVPFQALLSTSVFVLVVLIMRGRVLLAWSVVAVCILVGISLGSLTGSDAWLNAVLPRANATLLFIATCGALLLAPQIAEFTALMRRVEVDDRGVQAVRAGSLARDDRIRRIDRRVRPLLTKAVAGARITDDDVVQARLIEARLRDGIRGRSFDVQSVRDAVWDARGRGVSVSLLDDGGLAGVDAGRAAVLVRAVTSALLSELAEVERGDVVARIAPPGREPIATIVVVSRGVRRRIEIAATGEILRVVES